MTSNKKFFMMLFMIALFLVTVGIVAGQPQCDCENNWDCPSEEYCGFAKCTKYITQDVAYSGLCMLKCQGTCKSGTACPSDWTQAPGVCPAPGDVCCIEIPPTCAGTPDFDCGSCTSLAGDCGTCCDEKYSTICTCNPIEVGCKTGTSEAPLADCGGCAPDSVCCCKVTSTWYENKDCSDVTYSVANCDLCCCHNKGQVCNSYADCCQVSVDGDWCDITANVCCPIGCDWISSGGGYCDCHDPCYDPTRCAYRPPNDPGGGESSWWGDPYNVYCIQDTGLACCYCGEMYGEDDWYSFDSIVVYQKYFFLIFSFEF